MTAQPNVSQPPEPKKKRHIVRNAFLGFAGFIALIVVIAVATSGGGADTATGQPKQSAEAKPDKVVDKSEAKPEAKAENAQAKPQAKPEKAVAEPEEKAAGIGDAVEDGKFTFTVTKVEPGPPAIGGEEFGVKAQGKFVLVHVAVANHGDESQMFDGTSQTLYDNQDRKFDADTEAAIYLDDAQSFLEDINPGNKVDGTLVFDVPADVTPTAIELHDSMFSGGVTVSLK